MIPSEHQAMVDMLVEKHGREAIIAALPVEKNAGSGRPPNAQINKAVVWAHLQFLQKYRVRQNTKKLEAACGILANNLDHYLAGRGRQGESAFRKMHFAALRLARTDADFSLFMTTFSGYLDEIAGGNSDLVLLPLLEEGTRGGLRRPAFDMHLVVKEGQPMVQIHVWNDPPVVTFVLDPTQKLFE
jgi:hypothetical protein